MSFKLWVTVGAAVIMAILLLFVERGDSGDASASSWRGGARDPVRLLLLKPDGSFRRYTKLSIAIIFVVWLGVVWSVP